LEITCLPIEVCMDPLRILLLDDEPATLGFFMERFRREGDCVECCPDPAELARFLSETVPDVLVLCTEWAEDPLGLLERLKREWEDLPVILVSRNHAVPCVVEAMKKGARDYFTKPLEESGIDKAVLQAAKESRLLRKVNQVQKLYERHGRCEGIIGVSYPMQRIYRMIESVAAGDATVLISGESGVGKELVAQAIHRRSVRSKHPFVEVNCASIPRDLLESELFGYERGAFTGATRKHAGCCEAARQGTLFLDEICEMGSQLQAKLLRFLQEKTFRPLGSDRAVEADTRVVCATNRNPLAEVGAGRFREDLYYRISVIPIEVPPLRERTEDISILAMKFLEEFSPKYDKYFYDFSAGAMEMLTAYPWPGNVRELRNTVEQIVALNMGSQVIERFLPDRIRTGVPSPKVIYLNPGTSATEGTRKIVRLHEMEKTAILQAVRECQGNIREAARRLGLGQATLYRKIKKYDSEVADILPVREGGN
jgi:two-component system, repressor protein LuxO